MIIVMLGGLPHLLQRLLVLRDRRLHGEPSDRAPSEQRPVRKRIKTRLALTADRLRKRNPL